MATETQKPKHGIVGASDGRVRKMVASVTFTPAPAGLGSTGDPMFQQPGTFAGMPSMTVPRGLSEAGLPLGIQLIAAPLRDGEVLGVAAWCEKVLGHLPTPPV